MNICVGCFYCFTDSLEGVPPYPLYKGLASALLKCVGTGVFCRTCNHLNIIHEYSFIHEKQNEWQKLIMEKGSEALNVSCQLFCLINSVFLLVKLNPI